MSSAPGFLAGSVSGPDVKHSPMPVGFVTAKMFCHSDQEAKGNEARIREIFPGHAPTALLSPTGPTMYFPPYPSNSIVSPKGLNID